MSTTRQTSRTGELLQKAIRKQPEARTFGFKVTLTASPLAVTFAAYDRPSMADVDYAITLGGELDLSAVAVDESTISKNGFSILGGTGAEVCHVMIHGNVDPETDTD
jgi:hypothetical protein